MQEKAQIENYTTYVDLVWSKKNNHPFFIVHDEEPNKLQDSLQNTTLFDVKTFTGSIKSVKGLYSEFNWDKIQKTISKRESQIEYVFKQTNMESLSRIIDKMLNTLFVAKDE